MTQGQQTIAYSPTLVQAGLEPNQAAIYEVLIKNGSLPAGKIYQKTPLKRGLVYKVLDELVDIGLVSKKDEPGKVAIFEPAHPLKLKELAEQKEKEAKTAQSALEGVLGNLTSAFNLAVGKPGVQFYEGQDGIKRVLNDSLRSRSEIYSYADIESIVKYIDDINQDYVAKRERLKIKKRGILLDTPFTRQYLANYHKTVTQTRLIKYNAPPFQIVMQIYDGKVSYISLGDKRMIGVIIEDKHIYDTHKYLFEYMWLTATDLESGPTTPKLSSASSALPVSQTSNNEHRLE